MPKHQKNPAHNATVKTVKFLQMVHDPENLVRVFIKEAKGSNRHYVGYYDAGHLEKLAQDVQPYSDQATGIYYGLNPVSPSFLDKAKNCLKSVSQAASVKNSDILRRRLMLIDIDPVREPDCSATNKEKAVSLKLAKHLSRDLRRADWPKPVVVDSGNGYHLLFRVDLPVDHENLIRSCLKALACKYDSPEVKIDTGVADALRIAKLPGTMACKGISSAERPHRMSGAFKLPDKFEVVDRQLLEDLAGLAPKTAADERLQKIVIPSSSESSVARARAYLQKMEAAIEGQNGRSQFFNATCRLVDDFALTEEQARPLLDEYNQRCVPPFDSRGVEDKLLSALAKVSERGGPSGSALTMLAGTSHQETSERPAKFMGFVPDFGLASKVDVLASKNTKFLNGFWVWYWLLWRSLRSNTHVPDVMLRQWHWGANFDKNWKTRMKKNVGLQAIQKPNCSTDTCLLYGTGVKHDHYAHWINSYGILDRFCSPDERKPGCLRTFDVYGLKHKELREKLQREGHLFNVYWPALVLGSSRKVGWSWSQQRLVVGMVLELTRTKPKAGEDIAGEIIKGNRVAASKDITQKNVCPFLDSEQDYVSFAGNGKRKGRGYRLVGKTGKGWIYRAGYLNAPEMRTKERIEGIKSFLKDLEIISKDLGLIPAAIHQGEWKNLDEMIDCTRTGRGCDWLESCTMRIFTPADWRQRWRKFFSEKLGFEWIPASPDDSDTSIESAKTRDPEQITSSNQVRRWLKDNKWTQQRLANEIANVTGQKCSVQRVQRHLSGESHTQTFFEEVDLIKRKQQDATHEVTKVDETRHIESQLMSTTDTLNHIS